MRNVSRDTLYGIIIFLIVLLIFTFFNSQKERRALKDEYELKLFSLEDKNFSLADSSFQEGYDSAVDTVRDWFNDDFGYYMEIYGDGYYAGYSSGFDAGFDSAIESVDDWYSGG